MERSDRLRAIGERLASAGLTPRAVQACFAVSSLAHVPRRAAEGAPSRLPPAARMPWLWVAGQPLAVDSIRGILGDALDALLDEGWLTIDPDGRARATRAILPAGESFVVTDRADRRSGADAVLFPDDSAFHLLGALPTRRVERWLDVGTGSGIAPLTRRGLARAVVATDIHGRALRLARDGVALSGARGITLVQTDVLDGVSGQWDLITFNAPIPAEAGAQRGEQPPLYRHAPTGARVLERFWSRAAELVAPHGEVIVHSWVSERSVDPTRDLRGHIHRARYTPADADLAFAVTWWRPGGAPVRNITYQELSAQRPHIDRSTLSPPSGP